MDILATFYGADAFAAPDYVLGGWPADNHRGKGGRKILRDKMGKRQIGFKGLFPTKKTAGRNLMGTILLWHGVPDPVHRKRVCHDLVSDQNF